MWVRIPPRVPNRGKAWSGKAWHGLLSCGCSPTAEAGDLRSSQWGFDSLHPHLTKVIGLVFRITYVDGSSKRIEADSFYYDDGSDCFIFLAADKRRAYIPKRNVKAVEDD